MRLDPDVLSPLLGDMAVERIARGERGERAVYDGPGNSRARGMPQDLLRSLEISRDPA